MMKKRIILGVLLFCVGLFILFMPKSSFAATEIESINIGSPLPVVGEEPFRSGFEITSEPSADITISEIKWYENKIGQTGNFMGYTNEEMTGKFIKSYNYKVGLILVLPEGYTYNSNNMVLKFNLQQLYLNAPTDDYDIEFGDYGGKPSITVYYDYKFPRILKEISKIEITVPEPVIGEPLCTDKTKCEVKADGSELFEIYSIKWLKVENENYEGDLTAETDEIAEEGKEYRARVDFAIPNKYGLKSNIEISFNGKTINSNSDDFNYGSAGDLEIDETLAFRIFEPKEKQNEELNDEQNKEETKEEQKEQKEEAKEEKKTNNPKTGDTIRNTFIITIVSVAVIALTIKRIKEQNK